jgi:rod shape-determining protein MreC
VHSQKKNILKILAVFIVLSLIIVNSKNIQSSLRIPSVDFSSSALGALGGVSDMLKRAVPFASLRRDNRLLSSKVDLLNRKIEELKIVDDENKRLKGLLDFRKAIPYSTVPVQVIGRDPSNWSNSLIIDKGVNHGIKKNMAVLSTKGLVGRVVEVGRYSAKILLISDPNSKVGAVIRRNRQGGILVGRPDGECKMVYIALDSDVAPGDLVISAGFGSIFPKGILIGKVTRVGKEPGRMYKYAIVRPSQDLSRLEEVLCIK